MCSEGASCLLNLRMNCTTNGSENLLLLTDSYKISHHLLYPPNTTTVYSYFESRGGTFETISFFGLQYILKRWLCGKVVTEEKIKEARELYNAHFNRNVFNDEGWEYILKEHDGHLPIRIKAVPEGTQVPYKNVLFTVENTDPACFWLTNYLETLLVQVWYPMTVATSSRYQKKILAKYMEETADTLDKLPFMLHDYGFRGSTSVESAGIGGCAHLINFKGTDTIHALTTARKYYSCQMGGYSIPGTGHCTVTTWGRDGEVEAFRNLLTKFPDGLVGCVSDSYNLWKACDELLGGVLKELVESRKGGSLIVRPDSGDPPTVVVQVLETLSKKFGKTVNKKGYNLLPPYIRVIQGDGVSYETLEAILENMKKHMWSAENLAFGSGGALLQKVNRDTQKCAYKCSYAVINGKEVNAYKEPITDMGKKSKKGRLTLEFENGEYVTKEQGTGEIEKDLLVPVFENGKLLRDYTLDEIRETANREIVKQAK